MLQKIKNCPLAAVTRNGNIILFNHDVIVKGILTIDLTVESIVEVSISLYKRGIDVISVTIDEARMNYIGIEVL